LKIFSDYASLFWGHLLMCCIPNLLSINAKEIGFYIQGLIF
jgi:hypothetical protein